MSESVHESPVISNSPWTDDELLRAIEAYLDMLRAELDGQPYSKAQINRDLRAGPLATRTKGSIEFRMQNISAALYELKMPWIVATYPRKTLAPPSRKR
jgi:5-methylcytosine-specific restriction protein A